MSDDSAKETLDRLKRASAALEAAQKASRTTVREVARAKRSVAQVNKQAKMPSASHKVERKSTQKRAAKKHR